MTEVITWSGWVGGIAVGLYGLFQFILTGKVLGASTAYGNVCSYISKNPFFHSGAYSERNNWRLWFIIGLPLGGLIAALTSPGEMVFSFSLGEMYDSVFPGALWAKATLLTIGGILIGFGSRAASGCPSGHSIAGMGMLNPPSFLSSVGFFIGGILIVQFMFNIL